MKTNILSTWEAACIITGYGIGAGVLSMPYLMEKNGIILAGLILLASLLFSYILHLMIADICLKSGNDSQIIACLERFLFRGRAGKLLSCVFFILMTLIMITNLAAYISGADEVIRGLVPLPPIASQLLFYFAAASVVLLGLKAVGISEKYAVAAIFFLLMILAGASFSHIRRPLSVAPGTLNQALAYFGMAMFAMSAFFAVPQAAKGLDGDPVKVRRAVFLGLFNTFLMIVAISICSLLASTEVTEVSMVGWSAGIGLWAQLIGSLFTVLAMLTTYWSLSLALSGIVQDMFSLNPRFSWLIATLPSLLLVLVGVAGFMDLMRTAGGLIAIIVAIMIVPAYHNASRELPGPSLLRFSGPILEITIVLSYLLMAVGSIVPIR